jgi:uncharacterized protein YbbK (DUF523 family)
MILWGDVQSLQLSMSAMTRTLLTLEIIVGDYTDDALKKIQDNPVKVILLSEEDDFPTECPSCGISYIRRGKKAKAAKTQQGRNVIID